MGLGEAVVLFYFVHEVLPPVAVLGILLFLYFKFGWKAACAWVVIVVIGVVSFNSYFRFGFDQAIVDRAIAEHNPTLCRRLLRKQEPLAGFGTPIRDPRWECYAAYIQVYPSLDECERIGDYGCIGAVASALGDASVCLAYKDHYAISCIANVRGKTGMKLTASFLPECEVLQGDAHDQCVMLVVEDTGNYTLCRTLRDYYRFQECHTKFDGNASLKGIGAKMCPPIRDEGTREKCFYWFGINAKEPKLCEGVLGDDDVHRELREQCIRDASA